MHNLYQQFRQLLPDAPLQAGTVLEVGSCIALVVLPGGGLIRARGNATVGQTVFRARRGDRGHCPLTAAGDHRDLTSNLPADLEPALVLTHQAGFAFLETRND